MAAVGERRHAGESARRVEAMVSRHGTALLRVADRFSLCHDDALDAYQRALEIYLRRLDTVDPATEGAWLKVVVKHEAMAVRRTRQASVDREAHDLDDSVPASLREVEETVAGGERVGRSVEALRALKPDEARALLLKAEGLSYEEIGARFGWSYTKVNRSITEGRKHFLEAYEGIETGEACARHSGVLSAIGDGSATSRQVVSVRSHLRHCTACRARLRMARTPKWAAFAPLLWLRGLLGRAGGSDVVAGAQYAAASGGGRGTAVATLVGLCLTGAGAVCASGGALPAPTPLVAHATPAPGKARAKPAAPRVRARRAAAPVRAAVATPTPHPRTPAARTVAVKPAARRREFAFTAGTVRAAAATASPRAAAPAPDSAGPEFGFEGG